METPRPPAGAPSGLFYGWWRGDPLPTLRPQPGFAAARSSESSLLNQVAPLDAQEFARRVAAGHRPYIATLNGTPAACGWSATRRAVIGELDLSFALPPGDHYLWDFVTRPERRGRGLYPRLLQAILAAESAEAERFWIGHDAGNLASQRGILKAGFRAVGSMISLPDGRQGLRPLGPLDRAEAAARLLGITLLDRPGA